MQLAIKELAEIESLKSDWDGEGAEIPSPVAIESTRRFLEALSKVGEPNMSACANGSIDAFWRSESGEVAIVNFSKDGVMSFYSELGGFKIKGSTSDKSTEQQS